MAEFIEEKYINEWEVETPNGWKDFEGIGKTIEYKVYEVIFDDNTIILCADNHIFMNGDSQIYCKDLVIGSTVDGGTKEKYVKSITPLDKYEHMYDLLNVDGSIYYTNDIVSHNSTIVSAYALWYACFNSHKNIGVVSNKSDAAKNFLSRLKYMYELLPAWLKPGVPRWAEESVEFDNHTRIYTAATSKDSFRGEPMGMLICVTGDNEVTVRVKITGEIKTMRIDDLAENLRNN